MSILSTTVRDSGAGGGATWSRGNGAGTVGGGGAPLTLFAKRKKRGVCVPIGEPAEVRRVYEELRARMPLKIRLVKLPQLSAWWVSVSPDLRTSEFRLGGTRRGNSVVGGELFGDPTKPAAQLFAIAKQRPNRVRGWTDFETEWPAGTWRTLGQLLPPKLRVLPKAIGGAPSVLLEPSPFSTTSSSSTAASASLRKIARKEEEQDNDDDRRDDRGYGDLALAALPEDGGSPQPPAPELDDENENDRLRVNAGPDGATSDELSGDDDRMVRTRKLKRRRKQGGHELVPYGGGRPHFASESRCLLDSDRSASAFSRRRASSPLFYERSSRKREHRASASAASSSFRSLPWWSNVAESTGEEMVEQTDGYTEVEELDGFRLDRPCDANYDAHGRYADMDEDVVVLSSGGMTELEASDCESGLLCSPDTRLADDVLSDVECGEDEAEVLRTETHCIDDRPHRERTSARSWQQDWRRR
ncbi:Hypothetical protein UVM_LOCUS398 [uncultured virus]|nr:Hypothetical protein UVM_LOCUS398 [uncultured virus]